MVAVYIIISTNNFINVLSVIKIVFVHVGRLAAEMKKENRLRKEQGRPVTSPSRIAAAAVNLATPVLHQLLPPAEARKLQREKMAKQRTSVGPNISRSRPVPASLSKPADLADQRTTSTAAVLPLTVSVQSQRLSKPEERTYEIVCAEAEKIEAACTGISFTRLYYSITLVINQSSQVWKVLKPKFVI